MANTAQLTEREISEHYDEEWTGEEKLTFTKHKDTPFNKLESSLLHWLGTLRDQDTGDPKPVLEALKELARRQVAERERSVLDKRLDSFFELLLGRKVDPEGRDRLHHIKDVMRLPDDDYSWLMFFALEYYQQLFDEFPARWEAMLEEAAPRLDGIVTKAVKRTLITPAPTLLVDKSSSGNAKARVWLPIAVGAAIAVVAILAAGWFSLFEKNLYGQRIANVSTIAAMTRTDVGRRWLAFGAANSPGALTAIMNCGAEYGLNATKGTRAPLCAGASGTARLGWRLVR